MKVREFIIKKIEKKLDTQQTIFGEAAKTESARWVIFQKTMLNLFNELSLGQQDALLSLLEENVETEKIENFLKNANLNLEKIIEQSAREYLKELQVVLVGE